MTCCCEAIANVPTPIVLVLFLTVLCITHLWEIEDTSWMRAMAKDTMLSFVATLLVLSSIKKQGPVLRRTAPSKVLKEHCKALHEEEMTSFDDQADELSRQSLPTERCEKMV